MEKTPKGKKTQVLTRLLKRINSGADQTDSETCLRQIKEALMALDTFKIKRSIKWYITIKNIISVLISNLYSHCRSEV